MSLIYGYEEKGAVGSDGLCPQDKQVKANKKSIKDIKEFIGDASSLEGDLNMKGIQLAQNSALAAHSNNLLELENLLGTKTDDDTDDTAFGRIKKNINNVSIKETVGKFVAPFNDGHVDITGWTLPVSCTIIAVVLKANVRLTGLRRASIYSSDSSKISNVLMTSPMSLQDMKVGKGTVMFTGRGPSHTKFYANTVGDAAGSVAVRTVVVRFVYIDHT